MAFIASGGGESGSEVGRSWRRVCGEVAAKRVLRQVRWRDGGGYGSVEVAVLPHWSEARTGATKVVDCGTAWRRDGSGVGAVQRWRLGVDAALKARGGGTMRWWSPVRPWRGAAARSGGRRRLRRRRAVRGTAAVAAWGCRRL